MKECYRPVPIGVDGIALLSLATRSISGFVAVTDGTITVVDHSGATILDEVPVTGGTFLRLPFNLLGEGMSAINKTEAVVTLGGGASGTLAV